MSKASLHIEHQVLRQVPPCCGVMATMDTYQNPLAIHLQRQTQHLASVVPPESACIRELQNAPDTQAFLNTLSALLSNPAYTQIVATLFRPILMDLCARWLDDAQNAERNLYALAFLIEVHEELFPILSRLSQKYFPQGPLSLINNTTPIDTSRLSALLLAYYRIIRANRQYPSQCNWSPLLLSQIMWTEDLDRGVRMLAAKCYAIQVGMGDVEAERLEHEVAGSVEVDDCFVHYGQDVDGSAKRMDGWILETVEIERIIQSRNKLASEQIDFYHEEDTEERVRLQESDLSPVLANIEGVFLLKSSASKPSPSHYTPTPSGNDALRSLAHHISLRLPTLFTSAPSAGKALLLSHLAAQIYPDVKNQILTIHLADTSLDPRSLLGSYMSSTTQPGSFEWKEGVLVRAMREGKWVVLEDVDRAGSEVLGTLKPLVESLGTDKWIGGRASMHVPGRGEVEAAEGFMLFATRSLSPSPNGKFPSPNFYGAHKFHETTLQSPSPSELKTIIETQFQKLSGNLAQAAINLWASVKAVPRASSSRTVGLRELTKFCQRVEGLLPPSHSSMDVDANSDVTLAALISNPSLREDLYLEARDVFFGAGTLTAGAKATTQGISNAVGQHLGLDEERCNWLVHKRTPDFFIQKDANGHAAGVRVGRVYLPAQSVKSELLNQQSRPYALHRPAVCLLSRVASAITLNEPVLLTGETGTGKTSAITHLASILRKPLISLNLSHQTESSDLVGGLKPIDAHIPGFELYEEFTELFGSTFSRKKNEKFEMEVRKAVNESKWKRAIGLWKESVRMAQERLRAKRDQGEPNLDREQEPTASRKRRKMDDVQASLDRWSAFLTHVEQFEVQHVHGQGKFAFGFVEGPLVKALRNGDWILLDEINLASSETLESITSLLHGPKASITLTEKGELEPIPRHPDFRLFACMNPATDVGKKDLPPNIRARFTEIDVPPPDADKDTLLSIIEKYIGGHAVGDKGAIMNIAEFYMAVKDLVEKRQLADGSNHRPHFSMRSLSRALTFAGDIAHTYTLRRAVWEGCLMAFTMVLDEPSAQLVTALAHKHLLAGVRNPRSMLSKEPNPPSVRDDFVKFGSFYLEKGPLPEDSVEDYIMTPSVEKKLIDLARIILTRKFPVLIEGPTSSGKTSSIEYLARRTGHRFIRINNHEHTDIQEYLGSYVSDPLTGKLVFKDGLLVQALRTGSWIVLDELNLAPTDVLEALNRLLDDNRELVIPETGEVLRPHPHFMLFATQNPPGLYGGRKVLSRAFRNRFLEVQFEDVPQDELETILCQRCRIAPSYGKKIVQVFRELQKRRESSRVFESKQGFATLRDLFRWAGRDAVGYQELAENGYMLLAERTRREEDKLAVKTVLESVMNVRVDEQSLYDLQRPGLDPATFLGCLAPQTSNVIWTKAMQRLFVLVSRALKFNEPVLLVGETGSGKTSVCQIFSDATQQHLRGLNCHQNTETADIIGGLRPTRNRSSVHSDLLQKAKQLMQDLSLCDDQVETESIATLLQRTLKANKSLDQESRSQLEYVHAQLLQSQAIFEWHDGPLISAMRDGDVFLLDEISLAEDSVLERLNSVLEPARTIVLAEKSGNSLEKHVVTANQAFKLIATMNPGGDYGKKELSPALRNRFTEIWVPRVDERGDLELIINNSWKTPALRSFTRPILDFVEWLCGRVGDKSLLGLRDILAWVSFSNSALAEGNQDSIRSAHVFHHAASMTYVDGLASLPQLSSYSRGSIKQIQEDARQKLHELVPVPPEPFIPSVAWNNSVQIGLFAIEAGNRQPEPHLFTLSAPTTQSNAMRIARACQLSKPVLLEGSPGVGKTSLVTALANMTGHELHRINLSDQTDLVDLFGSDLPVEGGRPGEFAWRDGEFLQALQLGHWVLLDEMNLAPQAVLEGLNAVLDHRSTVYIPELGREFQCHPSFRIFAAQNPISQGGGRKGLPKSFVNRFTKVYIEELTANDYFLVCTHLFPGIAEETLRIMITFNSQLNEDVVARKSFGREGAPWEFNLRDIIRWGTLCQSQIVKHPAIYLHSIYLDRFRSAEDRSKTNELFQLAFSASLDVERAPPFTITPSFLEVGHFSYARRNLTTTRRVGRLLQCRLSPLESLGHCITQSWLTIIVGARNTGKTQIVRTLAMLTGNQLREIQVNSGTDTTDILGSFEQLDVKGRIYQTIDAVLLVINSQLRSSAGSRTWVQGRELESHLRTMKADLEASWSDDHLLRVQQLLSNLAKSYPSPEFTAYLGELNNIIAHKDALGRFEWVDGPLVQAMKLGQWVVLDGANLCNPSVLDRLNSLCELNGELVLSERGFLQGRVQVIRPHRDFRLCMLVDPQHGELSRAMRNRGVEVSIVDQMTDIDALAVRDHTRLPGRSLSIVEFDAIRRGVSKKLEDWDKRTSATRLIQQASSSMALSSQASLLDMVRTASAVELAIPFIFRTIVPAASALLTRYLSFDSGYVDMPVLRSLSQLPYHVLSDNVISFRAHISKAVTLSFKPVDLFLAMPQVERLHELPLEHHALLSYLELISLSYVVQECEGDELAVPADKFSQGRESLAFGVAELIGKLQHIIGEIISQRHDELENCVALTDNATLLLMEAKELLGSSNSPIFDFSRAHSSILRVMDILKDAPRVFAELSSQVEQVYRSLRLTTGVGLVSIWKAFYSSADRRAKGNVEHFSFHVQPSPGSRRHVFDALSVATLHPMPDTIWDSLQKYAPGMKEDNEPLALAQHGIDPQHLALELASLSGLTTTPGAACRNLQSVIKIHLLSRSSPMARLIPYQHLIWAFETDARPAETWARAISSWLEGVWHLNLSAEQGMGPEFLHSPIHLSQTVSSGLSRRLPLKSLAVYENEVRARVEAAVLQCHESRPTSGMLDALLSQNVYLVARCFAESFPGDQLEGILSLCGTTGAVPQQLDLLKQSRSDELRSLVQDSFSLQQYDPASPGAAWLSLSNLLFSLVVPNIPIDPARVQNARSMRLREEKIYLDSQIKLHSQLEDFTTGNRDNQLVIYLTSKLKRVHDELAASPSIEEARDIDRLHQFWAEVTQFSTSVIHPSKVTALANLARINATLALPQEQVIQESVRGFQHRLETLYDDFADIVLPIKLAILQFRLGLRLLLSAKPTSNIEQQFASSIIAFPTPSCVNQVVSQVDEIPSLGLDVSANCLLPLSAIAYDVAGGTDIRERVRELGSLYERLFSLWSIDQARTREAEQQANSLYRQNKTEHLAMTDAELETQEFLELFPQFEGVMESAQHPDSNSPESPLIRPDHTATLAKLHVSFFQSKRQNPEVPAILLWKLRRAALESLLASPSVHLPSELDLLSRQFQLSLLQQSAALLQPRPLSSSNLPNFYTECHVPEVKTLVPLVERMHQRIETLLLEWPDQEVLRHLSGCCQKVLELDLHNPVAKALAEIEQLLLQSEDWEIYANRDNSLKPYRDELISLIVRWRRLELSSWSTLLAAEATKMEDAAGVWWFRLYDLVVRGVLSAVAEVTSGQRSTMDEYLATLIPLVREFITSSPFGEYQVRMQMLVSFAQYLSTLADANNDETKAALDRVSQVLTVLHLHLDSYSAKLSSHLATERSKMEADIKKFIKLASWKDVNIVALKQSAQKSHHQLYKVVRKFRELLKQPVATWIVPQYLGDSPIASDIAPVWPTPVAVSSLPPSLEGSSIEHLRNLERTYKRFEAILDQEIRLLVRSSPYALPDELASEIITTSRRLASLTCPAGLEKDKRSKFLKSIQTQKRRAWSDMLKELKRIGFSYNTKADVARDNDSEVWIYTQPTVQRKPVSDPVVERSEQYFHVLQGCLPSLRLSLSGHHSDLSTRDASRGLALAEHIFHVAVTLRARTIESQESLEALHGIYKRLLSVQDTKLHFHDETAIHHILSLHTFLCRLRNALEELTGAANTYFVSAEGAEIPTGLRSALDNFYRLSCHTSNAVKEVGDNITLCSVVCLSQGEMDVLRDASELASKLSGSLTEWAIQYPELSYILHPFSRWLQDELTSGVPLPSPREGREPTGHAADLASLINTFLLSVQSLMPLCSSKKDAGEDEGARITPALEQLRQLGQGARINDIRTRLETVLSQIKSSEALEETLPRLLPFLKAYISLVEDQSSVLALWTKGLFKLDYALVSLLQTLFATGFCTPPEASDEGDDDAGAENAADGLGLGEGSGAQNVSKEIEDESQVEGLKGDENQDEKGEAGEEDEQGAIEMNEDFGGDMEDVPDNDDDEGDDDADSDTSSNPDIEEKIENLDANDPAALDEKLWGDESGPENKEGNEKADQDHSKQTEGESETVAKEGKEGKKDDKRGDDGAKEHQEGKEETEVPPEDDVPMEDPDAADENDTDPAANGAPIEEHIPDANTLDLPDDLDLGDENAGEDIDMKEDLEGDDEAVEEEMADPQDEMREDEQRSDNTKDEGGLEDEAKGEQALPEAEGSGESEDHGEEDEVIKNAEEEALAREQQRGGPSDPDAIDADTSGDAGGDGQAGAAQSASGQNMSSERKESSDGPTKGEQPAADLAPDPSEGAGATASGLQEGTKPSQSDYTELPNPLRSLGDAMKEIQHRFEEIMNASQDKDQNQLIAPNSENATSQLEYLHPDTDDQGLQALAAAEEQQVAKLDDLQFTQTDDDGDIPMDIDATNTEEARPHTNTFKPPSSSRDEISKSHDSTMEGAIVQAGAHSLSALPSVLDPTAPKADDDQAELGQQAELELRKWREAEQPGDQTENIWRLYESLTHDLAYALCEQLRLILEPTMATRLKGDYRTGKRLNMKKVISYIASDYTKDKIWLRRTKPSQREYQVLIAIDDSRSMAESHSIHLAFESLALISKALGRLESGDVAVVKFGEGVDVLHGFDEGPFTDQAGADVFGAFRFNQKATNVLSLMETSLGVLEGARERRAMGSSSAADLWQLEIIISDGMCQDHEKLRTMLRRAEERRIMVVFIILDSLHTHVPDGQASDSSQDLSQRSILNMDRAEFKNVGGRMELEVKKYLDSFPFEYYVVLRDVEALPDVLSSTLKQFFERIAEE